MIHRINSTLWSVLSEAFDMTMVPDLVSPMYAFQAYQAFLALFYNRAQHAKVAILNYGQALGYGPTPSSAAVSRLMKQVRVFALLLNIVVHEPPFGHPTSLVAQVVDGLLRTAHQLPERYRSDVQESLQTYAPRIKAQERIPPLSLLINLAPIVQDSPPFDTDPGTPLSSASTHSAMIADQQPVPEFRRVTDPVMQSPRDTDAAFVAQFRPSPTITRSRQAPPVARCASGFDYERRMDDYVRPEPPSSSLSRRHDDRNDADRLRQEHSSISRRPDVADDRNDVDRLRQENSELRRQLANAQPSKSRSSHRDSDLKHFAGAADEPTIPTFTALASYSAPDSDASDPDVPESFEQALTSHYVNEFQPPWLAADVHSMPRAHNMPGRAGYRDYPSDYSARHPKPRPL
jgi:hypothetical protein